MICIVIRLLESDGMILNLRALTRSTTSPPVYQCCMSAKQCHPVPGALVRNTQHQLGTRIRRSLDPVAMMFSAQLNSICCLAPPRQGFFALMQDDPTRTHEDAVSMLAVSAYGLQSRERSRSQNEEYQVPHDAEGVRSVIT
jgi:hypothetical protein